MKVELTEREANALAPMHLDHSVIRKLDSAISAALDAIDPNDGTDTEASVTFKVSMKRETDPDKETFGEIEATYSLAGSSAMKGKWAPRSQMRLRF